MQFRKRLKTTKAGTDYEVHTFFSSVSFLSLSHTIATSEPRGSSSEFAVSFPKFLNNTEMDMSFSNAFQIYDQSKRREKKR